MAEYLVFRVDSLSIALRVSAVERVFRSVRVSPLPQAPTVVTGVVNVHGDIFPVVSLRKRFGLADREISLSDQFLVTRMSRWRLILMVDSVLEMAAYAPEAIVAANDVLPGLEHVHGAVQSREGVVFIHDLERFLSLHEEVALTQAMATAAQERI